MAFYTVIETDDGLTIKRVADGQTPEDAAITEGGVLVDAGPYDTYEDARDALDLLVGDDEE